ncbi:DUF2681 domain-containing protein [Pasteurella multocida subsp. multocida]|uniref:DUF2681 domain-containing protein n=1 Tax=Pasteurella multocida TaxID=747 RepID=A0A9X3ZM48_PASMD|nr:DUF2681 domain-containing protein [Pasteurella multocida]MBF6981454.1 DUF2681 domain-containing protein [Pasteurella multocida]MDA5619115.1 DUF2681 domain-containing protein [Pasteurella multocida subsp. multocida]MDA5621595.1 DUF2681 domain-containing protein [Pasteurella multocida subsp. multocida]MDA5624063.1 DUF2681 domain-containing protein [Pasteurella multocida]ODS43425.1 hypothetical protein BGK37_11300 [Pasteurella multocida]
MSLQLILVAIAFFLGLCAYVVFKLKRANSTIDALLKENAQLEQDKAIVTTQRNNQRERKRNEETANHATRDKLIDSLHKSHDLRD